MKEIESDVKKQKISNKKKKDFLAKYHDGNPYSDCPSKCKTTCIDECYLEIHRRLVNDDYEKVPFEEKYMRNGKEHCCGKELEPLVNEFLVCTVCGSEY